jgi:hypothetical protein
VIAGVQIGRSTPLLVELIRGKVHEGRQTRAVLRGKILRPPAELWAWRQIKHWQFWGGCLCITVHPTAQGLAASRSDCVDRETCKQIRRFLITCGFHNRLLDLSLTLPVFPGLRVKFQRMARQGLSSPAGCQHRCDSEKK